MTQSINPGGDIHLAQFLKERTQAEVALILGVTQGAVHQMVRDKREIYFSVLEDGSFDHYEVKRSRRKKAA